MRGGGEMIQTLYAHINLKNKIKKEELMQKKKIWQAQSRGICQCPLNFFKDLFFLLSLYHGFLSPPPTLWLHNKVLLRE
jgi:hypothetical protein